MSRFEDRPSEDEMALASFEPGANPQRWESRVFEPSANRHPDGIEAGLGQQTEMQVLQQQIIEVETTGEDLSTEARGQFAFDRRQGPRRMSTGECTVERRTRPDRRERLLGFAGLLGAILSDVSPRGAADD